jgi:hypothetical protein
MKGQVSIFIIIGIVAIIILSFLIIQINDDKLNLINTEHEVDYSKLAQPATDYANACLNKVSLEAMSKLGQQGAIYPNVYIATNDRKIAYFYFKGKGYFPEKEAIEEQFSDYLKENIKSCINDFSDTKLIVEDKGQGITVKTSIDDKKISVEMIYPINVYFETKVIPLEKFNTVVKTDFSEVHTIAEKIIMETKNNPEWINLESLQDIRYDIRLIKVDSNTLVYEITDEKGLNDKPFKYTFAVKYGL